LSLNPNNVNANYNLGAYYVNQAAEIAQQYNEAKDEAKQKLLYAQMQDKFRQALPYLEKAHQALPEDLALLQSLIQVTTYLNLDDKAKEYLRKKEALTSKGK
jgi:tetratricopeptide (TPR) repeat protein